MTQAGRWPRTASVRGWPVALATGLVVTAVVLAVRADTLVGVFYDDGIYLTLAKSLAEGTGYRHVNLPGIPPPVAVHYPFGYPVFLSLLWRFWPAFPANVPLFFGANAVLLGLASTLLVAYLAPRLALSAWTLGAVVAAAATAIPLLAVSTVLFAEPLYLVFAIAACWAADRAGGGVGGARAPGAGKGGGGFGATGPALAGLLAAAAALTRSIGVVIVAAAAIGVWLARRRAGAPVPSQAKAAALALAVGALALAGWAVWVARHRGGIDPAMAANYGTYGELWSQAGRKWWGWGGLLEVVRPLGALVLSPLPELGRVLVGVPALLLAAVGVGVLVRAAPALGIALIGSMAVPAIWPYRPDRLVWAAFPWLWVATAAGAAWVLRRTWKRSAPRAIAARTAAVALVGVLVLAYGGFQLRGFVRGDATFTQREISATFRAVIPWLRFATPADAVLAGEDEALLSLYTGRRAVPSYLWRPAGRRAESLGPDTLRAFLVRQRVTHLLLTGRGSDAAPTVDALLERHPECLKLVRVWPGGLLAFEVSRCR